MLSLTYPIIILYRNTEIQKYRNGSVTMKNDDKTTVCKKKATFEIDINLHRDLKQFAAIEGRPMAEILEEALKIYLQKR